jgi:DNA topoisomerase-2
MAHQYKKETQREHVLNHAGMYIGSTESAEEYMWVYDVEKDKMVHRKCMYNPGLLKIVDEIIVNARDEYVRTTLDKERLPVKYIHVEAGVVDGAYTVSVENDGAGIPIEIHPTEKIYVPEMIFGNMLTSSNYNQAEEKIVGGTFGVGSKASNIFSKEFTVEVKDPVHGKSYKQSWTDNMSKCGKPEIKKMTGAKGLVRITLKPDLARFQGSQEKGEKEDVIHPDIAALVHTRVIELAASIGKDVKVKWNGADVPIRGFDKYMRLFVNDDSVVSYEECGERWQVGAVLTSSLFSDDSAGSPEYRHIAFCNGINNRRGGKHVEYVSKQILEALCVVAEKKKKIALKPGQLKEHVTFFVNSTIVNPSFDSQTKETLTTPASKFGSVPKFTDKLVNGLVKAGILDEAVAIMEAKLGKDAKKTDGSKKKTIRGLPKLEDALWAGTSQSGECTLILCEGDSAATSAIAGLKVVGRERWGVFPLKGKLLNVKDISREKFNANEELTAIKKILGLEQGKRYTSVADLRYGRVMIMSDQDVDGFHIRGLLMNLFHTEWATLMQVGFICTIMTPLVKMTKGSGSNAEVLCFYNEAELDAWRSEVGEDVARKYKSKYYKGLGTSTPAEAREWFENLADIKYVWDGKTNDSLDLAFNKKRADDRKEWLATYDPKKSIIVPADRTVAFSTFVHDELIHFSSADNVRSLPHIMDGLKPSQRKILYSCFKRNLRSEIRVAQLAGYVSEHAAYHHGEASLNQTITSMAQVFVGANNINYLKPIGQFGSRLQGGSDSASPRYIHTHLEGIVDALFKKEDLPLLTYTLDDGTPVEPESYLPVVPLLAINGTVGIGTGYSTNIPPHNPRHIVALLQQRLEGDLETIAGVALDPWWIGFRGGLIRKEDKQWITKALYEFDDKKCSVRITELPVGTWTKDYKVFLDKMTQAEGAETKYEGKPMLKNFDDLYNDVDVNFVLYLDKDYYEEAKDHVEEFEKRFHLTSSWKTTNMCCFDNNNNIRKYDTIGDMLEEYFSYRLVKYEERRAWQIAQLKDKIEELMAVRDFIRGVVGGTVKILNVEDEVLLRSLKKLGLPPRSAREEPDSLKAYEYLLRLRVDRMKKSSIEEAEKHVAEAEAALAELEASTAVGIWLKELAEFLEVWEKHEAGMMSVLTAGSGEGVSGGGKKAGKGKIQKRSAK